MAIKNKVTFSSDGDYVQFQISFRTFKEWSVYQKTHSHISFVGLLNLSIPCKGIQICSHNANVSSLEKRLYKLFCVVKNRLRKCVGGRKHEEQLRKSLTVTVSGKQLVDAVKAAEVKISEIRAKAELSKAQKLCSQLENDNAYLHRYIQALRKDDINPKSLLNTQRNENVQGHQQHRQIVRIEQNINKALWFLESFGMQLDSVRLCDSSGNTHVLSETGSGTGNANTKSIQDVLHIMDRFCIGDAAYHELTMVEKGLPRSYLIRQERNKLNNIFHIERTPGIDQGVQLNVIEEISRAVKQTFSKLPECISIKISGDGAKMARNSNSTIISFSILSNDEEVSSVYPVAIIKAGESYEMFQTCCSDVFGQFNSVIDKGYIDIDGVRVKTNTYLGAD